MRGIILTAVSYILGSVPVGLIVAYAVRGIDIRGHGSGNIGATNVFRVVSKPWGIAVFILDFAKGFVPVLIVYVHLPQASVRLCILAAAAAVCGHIWSLFLKFRGGKGVATSLGALAGLSVVLPGLRLLLPLTLMVWAGVFLRSRYVSLASLAAGLVFAVMTFMFTLPWEIRALGVFLFVFILLRHRDNIQRIIAGKEHRFGK